MPPGHRGEGDPTMPPQPTRVLVSFLGRPRREQGGQYQTVEYVFEDGHRSTTSFFGAAAAEWLLRNPERAPHQWLILGTPTSAWDQLSDVVLHLCPEEQHRIDEWLNEVAKELETGAIDSARLREFEDAIEPCLKFGLRLAAVESEGDAIFACLHEHIPKGGRVVLDITHGFRTMPTHALVSLGALAWLRDVRIDDILYGEMGETARPDDRSRASRAASPPAPSRARSLAGTVRLAKATPALARLRLDDDLDALAETFEGDGNISDQLRQTERLKDMMQFDRCGLPRGQALGALRQRQQGTAIDAAFTTAVIESLEQLSTATDAAALRARAQAAFERRDYLRAVALAYEALLLRAVELRDLRTLHKETAGGDLYAAVSQAAREECREQAQAATAPRWAGGSAERAFTRLGQIRNAIMHAGTQLGGHRRPAELEDAKALDGILQWSFEFWDALR